MSAGSRLISILVGVGSSRQLIFASLLCAGVLFAEPPAGYKLSWADEFDGSTVDTAQWRYRTGPKHWSTQKPENVSVANGYLVLALKKEKAEGKEFTAGGIISKQSFGYGYYESRFRIDAGKGWHSSFWLMGADGPGDTATTLEFDVIENNSQNLNVYHVGALKKRHGQQNIGYGARYITTPPLSGFHTYGCEYTPREVKYYFDGKVVQTIDASGFPRAHLQIWLTSLAYSSGKVATDGFADTRLPGRVEYDYVRFYTMP